jgi:hypothetical protein
MEKAISRRQKAHSQRRYAREEAAHLLRTPRSELRLADQIRLAVWPAPIAALLIHQGVHSGWLGGMVLCPSRMFAETLIALEILDQRLRRKIIRVRAKIIVCGLCQSANGRRHESPLFHHWAMHDRKITQSSNAF